MCIYKDHWIKFPLNCGMNYANKPLNCARIHFVVFCFVFVDGFYSYFSRSFSICIRQSEAKKKIYKKNCFNALTGAVDGNNSFNIRFMCVSWSRGAFYRYLFIYLLIFLHCFDSSYFLRFIPIPFRFHSVFRIWLGLTIDFFCHFHKYTSRSFFFYLFAIKTVCSNCDCCFVQFFVCFAFVEICEYNKRFKHKDRHKMITASLSHLYAL